MWGQSAGYIWWLGPSPCLDCTYLTDGKVEQQGQTEEKETAWYIGERQGFLYILLSPPPASYSRKTDTFWGRRARHTWIIGQDTHIRNGLYEGKYMT